jgi:hypothetical protein
VPDGGERGGRAEIKIQERDGEQHDNPPVGEKIFFHSHPIGNMLKIIDFIGDFEFHDSKKRLIPSHSTKKRQNTQFSRVSWNSCGMAMIFFHKKFFAARHGTIWIS